MIADLRVNVNTPTQANIGLEWGTRIRFENGAAVVAEGGEVGEAGEDVDFGEGQRGLADAAGFGGNGGAEFGEEAALDLDNLLLCVENLGFVFL